MRRKGIIAIISILIVLIVACILFLTGVIKIDIKSDKKDTYSKNQAIGYIKYMNACMLVSSDNLVLASQETSPQGITEIQGLEFKSLVVGQKLEPKDQKAYKYAIKIIENFKKNSMDADSVYISSDKTASVYVDKVKILFGKDIDTEEKVRDLREFYDKLKDLDGTLNMTEVSENNAGYTFKKN